jgi:parallel beta-helix repeat protein
VRDTAFHGVTTYSNLVTNNAANGIFYDRATAGNDIYGNTARANGAFDCRDNSTGGGTSGTANNWWGNGGPRSLPPGICE